MTKVRGIKGAASLGALAAILYLFCRTCLLAGVSLWLEINTGGSLQNPVGVSETAVQLISFLIGALSIALPVVWLLHTTRLSAEDLRLNRPAPWAPVFSGAVFLALANIGNIISGLLTRLLGIPADTTTLPAGGTPLLAALLTLCVLPAVGEELLFRGALQGLMRPCGSVAAIVGPALLFALLHLNLAQFIPALLSGLFLGWLAERSGSTLPGMLLHFINNCIAVLDIYLQLYAPSGVAMTIELAVLLGFPLVGALMLWRASRQGFSFGDGLRPGCAANAVFSSPAYTAAVAFLAVYGIYLTMAAGLGG